MEKVLLEFMIKNCDKMVVEFYGKETHPRLK